MNHLNNTSRKLMIGCCICLIIFLLIFALMYKVLHVKNNNDYHAGLTMINENLPMFSLPTLANLDIKVDQDVVNNKVNLINIWSSNCRSCKQEHFILMKIAKYIKNKKIIFIGLNYNDDQERAANWLSINGDPYMINLLDQQGDLASELGAKSLPALFLVDSNQIIRYRYLGLITMAVWEKNIRPVLDQLVLKTNK